MLISILPIIHIYIWGKNELMKGSNFPTFDVLFQYIVYDWINVFIHVFEQEWETILNSQLQLFQEVMIIECAHLWNIHIQFIWIWNAKIYLNSHDIISWCQTDMKSCFQTFRLFCSSLRFIQFRACCCGSIHIGNLLALVVKIPFWIDNSSGGRPSDVHLSEKESHPNLIAIRLLQNYTVYIRKFCF